MIKKAFTLAEVLITLGVIGIVAAMTLPSITQSAKKKEYTARLKKFDSMMQQAILASTVDHENPEYWDKPLMAYNEEGKFDTVTNANITEVFFKKYLAPYIKYTSFDKFELPKGDEELKGYQFRVMLADGSIFYTHNGTCIDFSYDVNGERNPNKEGYDRFRFLLCNARNIAYNYCGSEIIHWCSYAPRVVATREMALERCKTSPAYCSTLLKYDDWEFKDDYPFHL